VIVTNLGGEKRKDPAVIEHTGQKG
jgi:hypothetical protein